MPDTKQSRRPRRSREQWAALVTEQKVSGLTQGAFCTSRGLALSTFANAKRRVADSSEPLSRHDVFVPLRVDSDTASTPMSSAWDIELTLGAEVVLRIRRV